MERMCSAIAAEGSKLRKHDQQPNPNALCESIKYFMGDLHGFFMPSGLSSRHRVGGRCFEHALGSEELSHVEGGADW